MISLDRRTFVAGSLGLAAMPASAVTSDSPVAMHGLIGKMRAAAGERDALIAILLEGTQAMPGCLLYVVAKDPSDPDAIWITEVWDSRESHRASLGRPEVREAIARARPLIAGFDSSVETEPVGGVGIGWPGGAAGDSQDSSSRSRRNAEAAARRN